jgi:hypothetical protein
MEATISCSCDACKEIPGNRMCIQYQSDTCKGCRACKTMIGKDLAPCTCYYKGDKQGGPRCVQPSKHCDNDCEYCNPKTKHRRSSRTFTSDLRKTEKETKKAIKTAAMAYEATECAAGVCSIMGGQSRPSCPRATSERVKIAGRDRVVYVGPRGGRYIKSKGAYVRVV